jgi:hypothetical protein
MHQGRTFHKTQGTPLRPVLRATYVTDLSLATNRRPFLKTVSFREDTKLYARTP